MLLDLNAYMPTLQTDSTYSNRPFNMNSSQQKGDWITVKASSRKGKLSHSSKTVCNRQKLRARAPSSYTSTLDEDPSLLDVSDALLIQSVFDQIVQTIKSILAYHKWTSVPNHDKIFDLEKWIRRIQTIASLSSHSVQVQVSDASSEETPTPIINLHEIVCYGIGNFYVPTHRRTSSSSYSSSILQLACVLLLRRALSCIADDDDGIFLNQDDESTECTSQFQPTDFQKDQLRLKILYFDPVIHPIERRILTEYLHVEIIVENEKGKRRVDVQSTQTKKSTLFYMPHCPMRLYSNVLWANWNQLLCCDEEEEGGKIILVGNSFKAYDDRTMDSQIRQDPTNGIFPLLDFVQEESILTTTCRRNRVQDMNLNVLDEDCLEMAFQDCSIMYFQRDSTTSTLEWPTRPDEYNNTECSLEGYEDEIL